jgi:hypothetical protein
MHNYMYIGTTEIQIRTLTDVDLFSQFQWLHALWSRKPLAKAQIEDLEYAEFVY